MKFIVPFNGDPDFLEWLLATYAATGCISHVYFPGNPEIIGSGRKPKVSQFLVRGTGRLPVFDSQAYDNFLLKMVNRLSAAGIAPVLLFNGLVTPETEANQSRIVANLEELCEAGLAALIVGDLRFVSLLRLRQRFPALALHASVYFGISDPATAKHFANLGFEAVTVEPGINRQPSRVRAIRESGGPRISMLVNEGCLPFCQFREGHRTVDCSYALESAIHDVEYGSNVLSYKQMRCRKVFNEAPAKILQTPWIPPELLSRFEGAIDYAKLDGRSMTTENLKTTVQAYLTGRFDGDLRKIIGTFLHMDVPLDTKNLPSGFYDVILPPKSGVNDEKANRAVEDLVARWPLPSGPVFAKHVYDPATFNPPMERSRRVWNHAVQIIWKGGPEAKQHDRLADFGFPDYATYAKGARFWDLDGNEYLDYLMAWGTVLLGHGDRRIEEAATRCLRSGMLFNLCHESEYHLAQRLVRIIPGAEMVRFLISGSEATSTAIRIARAVTDRPMVVKYGFHGWLEWNQDEHPAGVLPAVTSKLLNLRYNDLDHAKELFRRHSGQIACIAMEPVKDELPRNGFLQALKDLAHENGALLVFDEIKTGFRLRIGGAQQYYGVTADLAVFSKAISNGFPLAVIAGKRDVFDRAGDVWINGTYHGWLPSIAAAHAVLDVLEAEPAIDTTWRLGEKLMGGFNEIMEKQGLRVRLLGLPPMPRPRYPADEKAKMKKFFSRMVELGYYMHPNHAWFLSAAHDEEAISRTLADVEEVVAQMHPV